MQHLISSFICLITSCFGLTRPSSGVYALANIVALSLWYVGCESVASFNFKICEVFKFSQNCWLSCAASGRQVWMFVAVVSWSRLYVGSSLWLHFSLEILHWDYWMCLCEVFTEQTVKSIIFWYVKLCNLLATFHQVIGYIIYIYIL
jgi:hypothetical protein